MMNNDNQSATNNGQEPVASKSPRSDAEEAAEFLNGSDGPDGERLSEVKALGDKIIANIQEIYDPEIPVNIYELGLIYKVDVHDDNSVTVDMTLTSPHCPVAETLPIEVKNRVELLDQVPFCDVRIVWEPPWHPSMMTEDAQLELGLIY